MARVYLSSTLADMRAEREAATRWLVAAGHLPVHSYVGDVESVHASCLADVAGCDLLVLLLGHRHGHVPLQDNPERLSITQMEFRHAGEAGVPRLALLRTAVPDVEQSDLLHPERNARIQAFRDEVEASVRAARFDDEASLIEALSTGVPRALGAAAPAPPAPAPAPAHTPTPTPTPTLASPAASAPPVPPAARPRRGLAWIGGGALLLFAVGAVAWLARERGNDVDGDRAAAPAVEAVVASSAAVPPAQPAVEAANAPGIALDGAPELKFARPTAATYLVLGLRTEPMTPEHFALRVQVRMTNHDRYPANLWTQSFRLLVDGVPRAPSDGLNEVVDAQSAKDGELVFEVPAQAGSLALRVIHHADDGQRADVPLRRVEPEYVPIRPPSKPRLKAPG